MNRRQLPMHLEVMLCSGGIDNSSAGSKLDLLFLRDMKISRLESGAAE